jgi:hypothetical protein
LPVGLGPDGGATEAEGEQERKDGDGVGFHGAVLPAW